MTEFFQPTTHVRADREWVSYVVPYVHRRSRTYITEEQIATVKILSEK